MSNLKVEGKVSDFCPKCKNCKNGISKIVCEDPYDGLTKELDANSDICCSMFEPSSGRYPWGVNSELIKASKRKDDLIQDYREKLKKANEENGTMYEDLEYWKERCHKAETDVTTLNSKVEVLEKKFRKADSIRDAVWNETELNKKISDLEATNKELTDKVGSLKNKVVSQQSTHYKQCARILELENMVNKLQSGEYDDILAKDIEIKSLQAKYDEAMAGWKDAIDTGDKLQSEIDNLNETNENLTKMVERRDRWVKELQNDVYTLQNEILTIRNIAQKAYDDTNRD